MKTYGYLFCLLAVLGLAGCATASSPDQVQSVQDANMMPSKSEQNTAKLQKALTF